MRRCRLAWEGAANRLVEGRFPTFQIDYRIGGKPRYYIGEPSQMLIPDELRKCAAFLMYNAADGPKLGGTVFFVEVSAVVFQGFFTFAVTAKHVIDMIRSRSIDGKVYIRLNMRNSSAQIAATDLTGWRFHPSDSSVDVAALPIHFKEETDHIAYSTSSFATDEVVKRWKIGIGDEVFLIGLFYEHIGTRRNVPILRVGNIAAMPEEPVSTAKFGPMEAYLVEARSIGGLSGSPVFVHLGPSRPDPESKFQTITSYGGAPYGLYFLLGLMHGHWDRPFPEQDTMVLDDARKESVNMGIAVVVPAKKILEVIHQPEFEERMTKEVEAFRKTNSPKPFSDL